MCKEQQKSLPLSCRWMQHSSIKNNSISLNTQSFGYLFVNSSLYCPQLFFLPFIYLIESARHFNEFYWIIPYEWPNDVKWKIELIFFFSNWSEWDETGHTHKKMKNKRGRKKERKKNQNGTHEQWVTWMSGMKWKLNCSSCNVEATALLFFLFFFFEATSFLLLLSLSDMPVRFVYEDCTALHKNYRNNSIL